MTSSPYGDRSAPRLYTDLAEWWPLMSAPEEYAEEAEYYRKVMIDAAEVPVREVLELGSGGGNNASHLKRSFDMTLVELSPAMVEVSRKLNPECSHVVGDMRNVRLDRTFDAVFVHDAVGYLTTEEDLALMAETAYLHCRGGGTALIAPDDVRETFHTRTDHGGHDGADRGLRYLEWVYDPDPNDTLDTTDYVYLLRIGTEVEVVHDRHVGGLFPRATWLRVLGEAGFRVRQLEPEGDRAGFAGVFECIRSAAEGDD